MFDYLFKEGLSFLQNVFEFCQCQRVLHKCLISCVAVFHFIFKLLKLGLKKKKKEKVNGRMNKQVLEMNNSQDLIVNSPL